MYEKYIKRIFDFVISILILPIFGVLFLFVGLAIIMDDGFPIFYNAKRIGKDGKLFTMYKFRSMKNNAPDIRLSDGSTYNSDIDPRVTRVGKILRSTSIDEIPQILNILKGDMSLIGPRPDPPDWLDRYPDNIKIFLKARPGITGYSQAYYRNSVDSDIKMMNDAFYATHCSFFMDMKIFFRTIITVFGRKNLYRDSTKYSQKLDDEEVKRLMKFDYEYNTNSKKSY